MSKLGNVKRVWQTAYQEVREQEPDIDEQIHYWETNRPENHDLLAFYETYVWAVYFTGIRVAVIEAKAEQIATALCEFDIAPIAADPEVVRTNLLRTFGHRQKADAAISTAMRLHKQPHVWDRLQALPLAAALAELRTFPYIGPQNCYHIARNLGWDAPMNSGFTEALADSLETSCDTLMGALAKAAGKRLNTTDTVIGIWSRLHESEEDCVQRTRALLGA